jgi:hypothetical protein
MGLSLEYDFVHLSVPYDESAGLCAPGRDTTTIVSHGSASEGFDLNGIREQTHLLGNNLHL